MNLSLMTLEGIRQFSGRNELRFYKNKEWIRCEPLLGDLLVGSRMVSIKYAFECTVGTQHAAQLLSN